MTHVLTLLAEHWPAMMAVFAVFTVAAASPGPATLGIMGTSMAKGRAAGMAFAAGVQVGSFTWAVTAAVGLSAWLSTVAWGLTAMKMAGAAYLGWLAFKSLRSALSAGPAQGVTSGAGSLSGHFRRGALLHLTNPKAVLAWIAIVALTQTSGGGTPVLVVTLAICLVIGAFVFQGYALVFASPIMMAAYRRARRAIEGMLAAVFGYAGWRLWASAV
ncbi:MULTISPECIES: LysE family transporter [unclassified Roseitalea]|uniref:LysE family transporter n=1 Tax=unclassified Roseitalea TaxID=2639107 RepID=UPI00273FAE0C|nr:MULTISPECIES: LysE family transporter [unclassified Roseitalea]